jgi:hypothetical protein
VVAAFEHGLAGAGVVGDGGAVVEHLVAGLDHQPVALGAGDGGHVDGAQRVDVGGGEVEGLAGVHVGLGAEVVRQGQGRQHAGFTSTACSPWRSASQVA